MVDNETVRREDSKWERRGRVGTARRGVFIFDGVQAPEVVEKLLWWLLEPEARKRPDIGVYRVRPASFEGWSETSAGGSWYAPIADENQDTVVVVNDKAGEREVTRKSGII